MRLLLRRHPPEDSRLIRGLTLATILVAMAAIGVHEEFAAQAAVAALASAVGFWISYRRRHARDWWLKGIIAVLILAVARDFFQTLVANPYDPRVPLVRLFLWLQALHSFDLPARKDLKYSLASAVVLMGVAGAYARDPAFGVFLVPFAIAASCAVVAMASDGRWAVGARPVLAAGVWLALCVLVAGVAVFAAVPHGQGLRVRWMPVSPRLAVSAALFGRIFNPAYPGASGAEAAQAPPVFNPQGYVGFSTYVDLRLRGELSDTVVLRVRTTRPAFWRGLAFDEYTGTGWRMRDGAVNEYASEEPRIVPGFGPDEPWPAGSEQVVQTFYVEAVQPNVIFAAYRPSEVYFPTASLAVDRYAGLRSPVPLEEGMIYSVISRVPAPPANLLRRRGQPVPEAISRRYLRLPAMAGRVHDLAREVTAGTASPYEKAVAVGRFLVTGYQYNLQAPLIPAGTDAVEHLLFVSKEGSCEAFASAMAVLLRAAGVPARLVTGYTTGSYNLLTGYYDVRNSDAHAWVEVFVAGVGWIEFEPTPGFAAPDEIAGHAGGQWLARDGALWAGRWMVTHAVEPVLAVLARFPRPLSGGLDASWGAAAVLLLTLALVRRRRPNGLQEDADASNRIYHEMLTALARAGVARRAATTPREFVRDVPPPIRGAAVVITETFETVRYGGRPVTPVLETRAQEALDSLKRGLRAGRRPAPDGAGRRRRR